QEPAATREKPARRPVAAMPQQTGHALTRPLTATPVYIRTCGGERKLSRPIVRCHATSQRSPGKPSQPAPSARASAIVTGCGPERTCYPPRMSRPRQALVCFIVLAAVASLAPIGVATAADRTNVPLKNWGGFSEFRDAVYDDLERLVTAGLAGRVPLDTGPLCRVEAGRLVARAIEEA